MFPASASGTSPTRGGRPAAPRSSSITAGGGGRRLQRLRAGRVAWSSCSSRSSPVDRIHALFLTGGGLFGLPAFGGVQRFLIERKVGYDWGTPDLRIPMVVSAVIDDLAVGDPRIWPDADAAYKACAAASTGPVPEGNVGAGAGATVGKMHRGRGLGGMKGGLGTASLKLGDVVIGALAVVNAAGDVIDWRSGRIVAGARRADGSFADSVDVMRTIVSGTPAPALEDAALRSTTLAVVATNVALTKTHADQARDDGQLRRGTGNPPLSHDRRRRSAVRHLHRDDSSARMSPLTALGSLAADVIAEAIVRGVRAATGVPGWPAVRDL